MVNFLIRITFNIHGSYPLIFNGAGVDNGRFTKSGFMYAQFSFRLKINNFSYSELEQIKMKEK